METKEKLCSHLPPVCIGLFQENKPLALSDADLPSVIPPVAVVILGLQDHRAAGDPAHCNPSGGLCGSCSRLLVPHRAPPGPWEHDFKQSSSARFAGSGLMVDTGDSGGVSRGKLRQVPGRCHDLQRGRGRLAVREQRPQRRVHFRSWLGFWLIASLLTCHC